MVAGPRFALSTQTSSWNSTKIESTFWTRCLICQVTRVHILLRIYLQVKSRENYALHQIRSKLSSDLNKMHFMVGFFTFKSIDPQVNIVDTVSKACVQNSKPQCLNIIWISRHFETSLHSRQFRCNPYVLLSKSSSLFIYITSIFQILFRSRTSKFVIFWKIIDLFA